MVHRIGSNLRRPYAPAATFLETINRFRNRQLPDSVDNDRLSATGLTRATASRVLFGLLFLGLITETGTPTQDLQALVRSGDQDYRGKLAIIIREAYQDLFHSTDPASVPQRSIINAFQPFEPASQHYRMAIFFLGMCREAGIPVMDEPRRRHSRVGQQPRRGRGKETRRNTAGISEGGPSGGGAPGALMNSLIRGMFELLPEPGTPWAQARKSSWLEAMRLNLDQIYPDTD